MDQIVLVVADRTDLGGRLLALAGGSPAAGRRLVHTTPQALATARWEHRLGRRGARRTTLTLPGGPCLTDDDLAAVWYRARAPLLPPAAASADPRDAWYAVAELTALVTSWLASLGEKVVNRPCGAGPAGPDWPATVWRRLADLSGMPAEGDRRTRTVSLLGGTVLGAQSPDEAAAVRELGRRTGCRALGLELDGSDVVNGTTVPDLAGGAARQAAAALLEEVAHDPALRLR